MRTHLRLRSRDATTVLGLTSGLRRLATQLEETHCCGAGTLWLPPLQRCDEAAVLWRLLAQERPLCCYVRRHLAAACLQTQGARV